MQVTLEYAQEHFADLVSAVNRGEEVEIAQPELPSLKLTGLKVTKPVLVNGKRVLGVGRGEMRVPSDSEAIPGSQSISLNPGVRWVDKMEWPTAKRPREELLGSLAGQIVLTEDWDSPQTNKEIQDWFEGSGKAETIASK